MQDSARLTICGEPSRPSLRNHAAGCSYPCRRIRSNTPPPALASWSNQVPLLMSIARDPRLPYRIPDPVRGRDLVRNLMERQHALIAHEQALAAGMTDGQVRRRLRMRHWLPARPGVYAAAGAPATFQQAVLAAILSIGGSAVASHGSAAA